MILWPPAQAEEDVTLKYFTQSGERALERHALNDREQDTVVAEYMNSVMEKGVMANMRGRPIVIPVKNSEVKLLLTNASLTQAVYNAAERDPNNPYVQASLKEGLKHCKIYHPATPADCCVWMRDTGNAFHRGSAMGIMELYDKVQMIESQWKVYKEKNHITARGATNQASGSVSGYDARMYQWVEKTHPGVVKTQQQFLLAKAFVSTMRNVGAWDLFRSMAARCINYLDPTLDNLQLISSHHQICNVIVSKFSKTVSNPMFLKVALVECLRFSVPTVRTKDARVVPVLLSKAGQQMTLLLNLLTTPMAGSVAYTKPVKVKAKVKAKPRSKSKAKAAKKGKAQAKGKGKANGRAVDSAKAAPEHGIAAGSPEAGEDGEGEGEGGEGGEGAITAQYLH